MSRQRELLYSLLPAYLRYRDYGEGEPLRALMKVLEIELNALEGNIGQLYENWFIETCEDWVVPYIGDLLAVSPSGQERIERLTRPQVGNTLAYRRRKGLLSALAWALRDVTGWPNLVVGYGPNIVSTQSLESLRPKQGGSLNLRDVESLKRLRSFEDEVPHTVDLFDPGESVSAWKPWARGRFNLPVVGIYFFRLGAYPVMGSSPAAIRNAAGKVVGYSFHPFVQPPASSVPGFEMPLFNQPESCDDPSLAPRLRNVPAPLDLEDLRLEIEARREGREPRTDFLGKDPVLRIARLRGEGGATTIPVEAMEIADLSTLDLEEVALPRTFQLRTESKMEEHPVEALVDPRRGRFVLLSPPEPGERLLVSFSYGFNADLGGGPYARPETESVPPGTWQVLVSRSARVRDGDQPVARSLEEALDMWRAADPDRGAIRFLDSDTYELPAGGLSVSLRYLQKLVIQSLGGRCPTLVGDLKVEGSEKVSETQLGLEGLWIDGRLAVDGCLRLTLSHCTLRPFIPGRPQAVALEGGSTGGSGLEVILHRSIVGPVVLATATRFLRIAESILCAGEACAVRGPGSGEPGDEGTAPGPATSMTRSTILGKVDLLNLVQAKDTLFTQPVSIHRPSLGVVTCSYLPGERPKGLELVRTQPAYEVAHATETAAARGEKLSAQELEHIRRAMRPRFVSELFGQPGFAQLSLETPSQIRFGAEDGSEMGAFQASRSSQREASISPVLDEYLRWGMEPRVFYVT